MKWEPPNGDDGEPCRRCVPAQACCPKHSRENQERGWRGQRSIFTHESKAIFLEAKEYGASDQKACAAAGWSVEAWMKWNQSVRRGDAYPALVDFIELEVPKASKKLYDKALNAIRRGLENEDADKAAKIGLSVMEKMYGRDLDTATSTVRHEGAAGGPVEFRIVYGSDSATTMAPPEPSDDAGAG